MTITDEAISRFRFNSGEGIDADDDNGRETLLRRALYTELLGCLGAAPWADGSAADACRVVGNALKPVHVPATSTVRVTAGLVLFAPAADPGTPEQWALAHRLGTDLSSTYDVSSSSANGSGSNRNDILTVKVTDSYEDAADEETRDFEDAVSGVVTTQATAKRYRTQLTLQVIEGTPGAGDPAVPAGEVMIARYVMNAGASTYSSTNITDFRVPLDWLTGNLTVDGGITAAGGNIDFGGAASIQLPQRTLLLDIAGGAQAAGTANYNGTQVVFSAASAYDCPIPLHAEDQIVNITAWYSRDSGGTITFSLFERDMAGANTALATKDVSSGTGAGTTTFTSPTTGSLPQLLEDGKSYFIRMAGGAADDLFGYVVDYDRP